MNYCSEGKHRTEEQVTVKNRFGKQSTICKLCFDAKRKRIHEKRKYKMKRDDVYNNLFFDFRGL